MDGKRTLKPVTRTMSSRNLNAGGDARTRWRSQRPIEQCEVADAAKVTFRQHNGPWSVTCRFAVECRLPQFAVESYHMHVAGSGTMSFAFAISRYSDDSRIAAPHVRPRIWSVRKPDLQGEPRRVNADPESLGGE